MQILDAYEYGMLRVFRQRVDNHRPEFLHKSNQLFVRIGIGKPHMRRIFAGVLLTPIPGCLRVFLKEVGRGALGSDPRRPATYQQSISIDSGLQVIGPPKGWIWVLYNCHP
jgi:hypothetical protein